MKLSKKYLHNKIAFLTTVFFGFLVFLLGVLLGSTPVSVKEIFNGVINGNQGAGEAIFLFVRLPRVSGAFLVGAALAVSGAILQGVLGNSLASPSVIGVNAGAGLAVTVCASVGIFGGVILSLFSFIGAFITVIFIAFFMHRWGRTKSTIVLAGVAINSLLNAFSDAIITFKPETAIMSSEFKIGDLSSITYQKLIPAFFIIVIALIASFIMANELDVLSLGQDIAKSLGMNTYFVKTIFLFLGAVLAGCAVSMAGLISFVGLIVPHMVKRFFFKARLFLPMCALWGGIFVALCDTVARCAFSPFEIPVGIIMAFFGAPFFILILIKGERNNG